MEIKNNKRIINARPLFLIFVGLIFGIYFMYKSFELNYKLQFNFAILFLLIWSVIFTIWLVLYFIKKDNLFFAIIKRDFKYVICFTVSLVLGLLISYFSFYKYFNFQKYEDYSCNLIAIVDEVSDYRVTFKDCKIAGENGEEVLPSGAIFETNGESYGFIENSTVSILCNISLKPIFRDNFNFSQFINGYSYIITVDNGKNISILSESGKSFAMKIRDYVRNILFSNMSEENAGISFAMLFGKKDFVDNGNLDAFSMAGISHILAVSGLHIGVLVAVLYFVLKKIFKSKSLLIILVLGAFLVLYSYICDFSASVVRATIMSIVLLISKEYGYRYDGLNSLSIAGIIVLLFSPLSLFNAGFQLSFLCIFSIISLAPFITSLFLKIKCPRFLASSLAISLSTNILILPVCANLFNKISIISIFANILVIPFFSICFVALFAVTIISCLISSLGILLIVPEVLLHGIKVLADLFASVQSLYITLFGVTYILLFLIVLVSFFIHFLMLNKKVKGIICGSLVVLMISILTFANLPLNLESKAIIFNEFSSNNISIMVGEDDSINLIGYNKNEYLRENLLIKNKIRKIDSILVYNFELNMLNDLKTFILKYDIQKVLLPSYFANFASLFDGFEDRFEFIDENSKIADFNLVDYSVLDKSLGIELFDGKNRFLFANISSMEEWAMLINRVENDIDFMFVEKYKYRVDDYHIKIKEVICNTSNFNSENITKLIYKNGFTKEF